MKRTGYESPEIIDNSTLLDPDGGESPNGIIVVLFILAVGVTVAAGVFVHTAAAGWTIVVAPDQ